jgi:hypothetical protein
VKYNVTLEFDPDELIQTFADNQGISIQNVDLSVENILEQEVPGWLDASGVSVKSIKKVEE